LFHWMDMDFATRCPLVRRLASYPVHNVPSIITAIAVYYLAGRLGLIGNFLWLLCHAVIAMPIVLLILLAALHAVDPNLGRAALGLGGSRLRVFCRIVLPLALPGILSAALFAFLTLF